MPEANEWDQYRHEFLFVIPLVVRITEKKLTSAMSERYGSSIPNVISCSNWFPIGQTQVCM